VDELPVKDGHVLLPVPELPVYVELAAGQSIEVVPQNWGEKFAKATVSQRLPRVPANIRPIRRTRIPAEDSQRPTRELVLDAEVKAQLG